MKTEYGPNVILARTRVTRRVRGDKGIRDLLDMTYIGRQKLPQFLTDDKFPPIFSCATDWSCLGHSFAAKVLPAAVKLQG